MIDHGIYIKVNPNEHISEIRTLINELKTGTSRANWWIFFNLVQTILFNVTVEGFFLHGASRANYLRKVQQS